VSAAALPGDLYHYASAAGSVDRDEGLAGPTALALASSRRGGGGGAYQTRPGASRGSAAPAAAASSPPGAVPSWYPQPAVPEPQQFPTHHHGPGSRGGGSSGSLSSLASPAATAIHTGVFTPAADPSVDLQKAIAAGHSAEPFAALRQPAPVSAYGAAAGAQPAPVHPGAGYASAGGVGAFPHAYQSAPAMPPAGASSGWPSAAAAAHDAGSTALVRRL